MNIGELKAKVSIEPWATQIVAGMLGVIEKGMEAGMPLHVAEEIARETAKLAFTRAVKVEMPKMELLYSGNGRMLCTFPT